MYSEVAERLCLPIGDHHLLCSMRLSLIEPCRDSVGFDCPIDFLSNVKHLSVVYKSALSGILDEAYMLAYVHVLLTSGAW